MTGDSTRTFVWDAEDRLTRVTQGATELARFTYDGQGRRTQKVDSVRGVTHTYIYDEQNIIEERLSSGQTYDYVHGPGIDRPLAMRDQVSVVSYYLADHLGSIVQTTSSTGAVTLTREYDPWGNPIQGSATSGYAFIGREWDFETGLYYYRARYYDPKLGRFISEDPLGFDSGDANFYAYVSNNPTNFGDPSGLAQLTPQAQAVYCGPPPGPNATADETRAYYAACRVRMGLSLVPTPGVGIQTAGNMCLTGFTRHGMNRIIQRGVSPQALLNALKNPTAIVQQAQGTLKFIGQEATVILNELGRVVTAWGGGL